MPGRYGDLDYPLPKTAGFRLGVTLFVVAVLPPLTE